ncbi:MerR family transcriptional regulator [Microterricola pindariensis]|uniref:MerR family transcriptional regulator n=1 Tax=Microterricola pindariensis TaxID=478010 RepID=A0ABX5AWN4_9MICO|nr:MerR family transcriptional regulator [Microterricola pindariensis]PPL19076.1 MerR family transcriptional regulator [Microterricola pindariensis]
MDWSIQEIAKLAGTTSRTLRHYDVTGLLAPSRVGANGYRHYDQAALVRLQRILLLRELGLGLPAIAEVLANERDEGQALRGHLDWLQQEQHRLARQIASVRQTIHTLEEGKQLMAENMFDGFDNSQYKDEVEERWGKAAYATGDVWWSSMSEAEKGDWQARQKQLAAEWADAAARGVDPGSDEAQALALRHFEWLRGIPGTPGGGTSGPPRDYLLGLAELYVADERFAANYGGTAGAEFVRAALTVFADRQL